MIALVAGIAASAAVLLVDTRRRRAPIQRSTQRRGDPATPEVRSNPVETLGRILRTATGRAPDHETDTRLGVAVCVAVAMVVVDPVLPPAVVALVVVGRRWRRVRRRRGTDDRQTVAALPEVVDLLRLAIGAGHTVPAAIPMLAAWAPTSLRSDLRVAAVAISRGQPTVDAVESLQAAWGDPARPLLRALADHLRNGTPILPTLERVAHDARGARRRAAESRARRLPVLLLFPLVFCTLPAFGLLTVAPIVAGTLRSLDGERLETAVSITYRTENPSCTQPSSPSRSPRCRS